MNYISVCSGIEAATVAWHDLGFNPVGFSEIEPFPCEVLAHHYQHVPNFGDMTKFKDWNINDTIDLVVGGTPCQSFSVAGLRKGLNDPRGNLCLTFLAILEKFKPRWFIWENVPGVLSSGKGNDFASFLSAANEIGYSCAWRIFDAQYFGVPQRRRRVFVVGYSGDWRYPASVLFEPEGLRGNIEQGGKKGQSVTCLSGNGTEICCEKIAQTLDCSFGDKYGCDNQHIDGGASLFVLVAFQSNASAAQSMPVENNRSPTLTTNARFMATCFYDDRRDGYREHGDKAPTLTAFMGTGGNNVPAVQYGVNIRRLMPVECERLQGFPDHYTQIPYRGKSAENCPDGPRYKAIGNSMAVPVMRWIGERIKMVDSLKL